MGPILGVQGDLALAEVVKLTLNLAEGRHLTPSTSDGLKKIEEDLDDE